MGVRDEPASTRTPLKNRLTAAVEISIAALVGAVCPTRMYLPFSVKNGAQSTDALIFVDSGAQANFITPELVQDLGLTPRPIPSPLTLTLAEGTTAGRIDSQVELDLESELLSFRCPFLITKLTVAPIILGLPWLRRYNPTINWADLTVTGYQPVGRPQVGRISGSDLRQTLEQDDAIWGILSVRPDQEPITLASIELDPEGADKLPPEFQEYRDVFSEAASNALPPRRPYDHGIDLEDGTKPPHGPIYPLSVTELDVLKKYIDEHLANGFITPSTSPAAAPILFVKKKDGSLRLCVDYRGLNRVTIKNRCPLPLIHELLDRLRSARFFSKIDLRNAYHQIRIKEGDEWKTAFRTRYGLFEYRVMPFGLTNAPASFQHLVNDVFADMTDRFVVAYLDDVLIYSDTREEHTEHVRAVLARLRDNNLYAKQQKCEFYRDEVEFLGYRVSAEGVSMDPGKVADIQSWPTPKTVREVMAFLGFANFYRQFIRDYSDIAAPLTNMTKKKKGTNGRKPEYLPFVWTPESQQSFDRLKDAFVKGGVLHHFDPERQIVVEADASDFGIGGILSQVQNDSLRPIAFFSKKMGPAELNYPIHDKELLVIILCFKAWRHYLEGARYAVRVITDHQPLIFFAQKRELTRRQARWSIFLQDFHFTIEHRAGKDSAKPDALSRRADHELTVDDRENQRQQLLYLNALSIDPRAQDTLTAIRTAQGASQDCQDLVARLRGGEATPAERARYTIDEEGLVRRGEVLYVPEDPALRLKILKELHDSTLAGHPGRRRTRKLLQRYYYWPGMTTYADEYVRTCECCQRNKYPRHKPYGLLKPLPIPERPWMAVSMDLIERLPASGPEAKFNSILVVVDRLTKMAVFEPCDTNITAPELADIYVRRVFSLHGAPVSIVSDRGSEFTSGFWRSFTKALGISSDFSTSAHPETDGQTEIVNQWIEQYLRCYSNYKQDNWYQLLPIAEYVYNNTPHTSAGNSPFFLNYGYHPRSFFEPTIGKDLHFRATQFTTDLTDLHKALREELQSAIEAQARYANKRRIAPPDLKVGDLVRISMKHIDTKRTAKKLDAISAGPYPITEVISSHAFRVGIPRSWRIHDVFNVSRLSLHHENTIEGRHQPEPPPVDPIENTYEVEMILDSRIWRNKLQYKVKWVGYDHPDSSDWEPHSNLTDCAELVQEFHERYPTAPGPKDLAERSGTATEGPRTTTDRGKTRPAKRDRSDDHPPRRSLRQRLTR